MLRIFKNFTKKETVLAILSALFIVSQVWLDLKLPDYMQSITVLVQTPGSEMNEILREGGKMLACAAGSLMASIIVAIIASKIASNFTAILREKLFNKVQGFSMKEMNSFSTASLITRSTNDINQMQMLIVMGLQVVIKAPIMAVWGITKISGKSSEWTMSMATTIVLLIVVLGICILLAMPKFKKLQFLTDDVNRVTRENLTGISVVRAYNAENYQNNKFAKVNENLTSTHLFAQTTMAFMMPSVQLAMTGLPLAVYWIGAYLIQDANAMDKIDIFSQMVTFSSYAIQIIMAFMMLIVVFVILPRASVATKRILEVLDSKTSIVDGCIDDADTEIKGEIEFKNVSFKYPDASEYVLRDISFKAHKGETIAFIGSTGSGKSTVVNLVPRFYDVTDGEVLVDGIDVRKYTQNALHKKIGYVSQKAILFAGDIETNISYGDNKDNIKNEDDLTKAIDIAQATEFVNNEENGIKSFVAQGGENYSGGQKQRISIARAIARNPEIFVFDDSFSALDYKTDKVLRKALKDNCADATKLIVAQRIGTIKDADRIVVLDDGNMVGIGTHEELMDTCEVYRQIAYSQLSKEELS